MSAIQEFAAKQQAHNAQIDTAVQGLGEDIAGLKALIVQLQTSAGEISPEDQATLDALEAKTGTIADSLDALDQLTPPVVPPAVSDAQRTPPTV